MIEGLAKAKGRPASQYALMCAAITERSGVALRRIRWAGHGWPLRVIMGRGVRLTGTKSLQLAPGTRINDGVWLNTERNGRIIIESRSSIGRFSTLSSVGELLICNDVLISPGVLIMDHSHGRRGDEKPFLLQEIAPRGKITIEPGCWLGANVCVLSGADDLTIGAGSVIGAGAIVTTSCPPASLLVGPRAKAVETRSSFRQSTAKKD